MPTPADPSQIDPAIALVEEILEAVANPQVSALFGSTPPRRVTHALWLCNCYSEDDWAPVWEIIATEDGVGWRHGGSGTELHDVVSAQLHAGGHVHPADVLSWLQGADMHDRDWYGHEIWGDLEVLDSLSKQIRGG